MCFVEDLCFKMFIWIQCHVKVFTELQYYSLCFESVTVYNLHFITFNSILLSKVTYKRGRIQFKATAAVWQCPAFELAAFWSASALSCFTY